MEQRRIKAYGFRATLEFIEHNYDQPARARILAGTSPQTRDFVELSKKSVHQDPVASSELWTAMVKEHGDKEEARLQLVRTGRRMGEYATNTYLRLIMRILTVRMFAKKFPDLWARDANFGKVILENVDQIDKGTLSIKFSELGPYPYFGPICQGWLAFSLETMGLKNVNVSTVGWSMDNPDPEVIEYKVTWTN